MSRSYERIWGRASAELRAECVPLGRDFLEIRLGGTSTRVRQSMTMLDDAVTLALAGDSEIGQRLLADQGLTVPESVTLERTDAGPALGLLRRSPAGCVVKPASAGSAGRGVTCGVQTPGELALATRRASGFGLRVQVEPMVAGDNYRLLFLHGELLDVRPVAAEARPRLPVHAAPRRTHAATPSRTRARGSRSRRPPTTTGPKRT